MPRFSDRRRPYRDFLVHLAGFDTAAIHRGDQLAVLALPPAAVARFCLSSVCFHLNGWIRWRPSISHFKTPGWCF
jgi:hypothetical protein